MSRILVAGSRGMLGSALMARLGDRALGLDMPELDITSEESVSRALEGSSVKVIINAAAITDVDLCERDRELSRKVHHQGVRNLCQTGVRVITLSTDHVFTDGRGELLTEESSPDPANEYGRGKLLGEEAALKVPGNCVVRTSWLFGSRGVVPWIVERLLSGRKVRAVADQTACITLADHLADALIGLALDESAHGVYHCVNDGAVTPFSLAAEIAERTGRGTVTPVRWSDLGLLAPRPVWSALGTVRNLILPTCKEAVESWMRERQ